MCISFSVALFRYTCISSKGYFLSSMFDVQCILFGFVSIPEQ